MKINPNDPAYPNPGVPGVYQDYPGIPIRLEIAARMMVAIISDQRNESCNYALDAGSALDAADALIAAYNESEGK